ncbi:hypothetical protein AGOR_G00225030 [Albula goreensis]|uniref:Uncharacterized protein n=1 Tax=Albula goreensis TaxID=1534307 RepID=A0A8T3CLB0_9TELE|nr:hypothetical protein AGOR_G00225030 [Albula goreensis]
MPKEERASMTAQMHMLLKTGPKWIWAQPVWDTKAKNHVCFHQLHKILYGSGVKVDDNMGVKIEVFRMMLYLSFPVAMFWISNQAEYFEEYVVKRKREICPPDEKLHRKELEEFKERMRNRKEQRLLKEMSMESEE